MVTDIKHNVSTLYEIMVSEGIQELEVNSQECSIYIKRKDYQEHDEHNLKAVQREHNVEVPLVELIKSPITGTVYLAPSPLSRVFVNNDDVVEVGDVLCIVEAMKTMNEIKATFKAKIVKILVENGNFVNAGQDLFSVEKI